MSRRVLRRTLTRVCCPPQVRWWDVETGANTETHVGSKAVYCVAAAPGGSSSLVAYGGAERALRLWDARTPMGKETVRLS